MLDNCDHIKAREICCGGQHRVKCSRNSSFSAHIQPISTIDIWCLCVGPHKVEAKWRLVASGPLLKPPRIWVYCELKQHQQRTRLIPHEQTTHATRSSIVLHRINNTSRSLVDLQPPAGPQNVFHFHNVAGPHMPSDPWPTHFTCVPTSHIYAALALLGK